MCPIYEYECSNCGTKKEIKASLRETSIIPVCEKCNQLMKRILSTCSFILRGNNWAKNGYSGRKK
jgi:putative FmdB family regulatory protein